MLLRAFRLFHELAASEKITWSFALGFGMLGWIYFFLGFFELLSPAILLAATIILIPGLLLFRDIKPNLNRPQGSLEWLLIALVVLLVLFDIAEGIAPPSDADTLAYHFARPKEFLTLGQLNFVPRAGDGTQPFLIQMAYLLPLAYGGSLGVTLWVMVSGWMSATLIYVTIRRHLDRVFALAFTAIFLTTPAFVAAAGTGQVEPRLILFVVVAGLALVRGIQSKNLAWFAVAGLAAGLFAGSKYFGLIFAGSIGLVTIFYTRQLITTLTVGGTIIIAGFQWYMWNWINVGDPLYPLLLRSFDIGLAELWSPSFRESFETMLAAEAPITVSLWTLLTFPITALFQGVDGIEPVRIGLGIYTITIAPLAMLGAWNHRQQLYKNPLFIFCLIALLFYIVWFLPGLSQRTRFLLPIYPLVAIAMTVAAVRYCQSKERLQLFWTSIAVVLIVQLGGAALYSQNYLRKVISAESNAKFLDRNVVGYSTVQWINENIETGKIYTPERQTIFLFDLPVYYGHQNADPTLDWRLSTPIKAQHDSLTKLGVTHLLLVTSELTERLEAHGSCFELVRTFERKMILSRTLGQFENSPMFRLFALTTDCE